MRRAFLGRVAEMIKNEPDTTFFTVDIGMWAIRDVLRDYPDRCTNVGIYEDGMFTIAAGMARRGLIPTIFGIQPYLIERTLEQIKMDLAYQKLGVKACPCKRIDEEELINIIEQLEIQIDSIKEITINSDFTLYILNKDGREFCSKWKVRSRRDSWTPVMREKARQREMERQAKLWQE